AGDGIQPGVNPGFAGVNLLPSANQTNDDCPLLMPVHVGNKELWLGVAEATSFLLSLHEAGGLTQIPGTLRFVENYDVIVWWAGINQRFIPEMMDVLNECLDAFTHPPFPDFLTARFSTCDLIARERLAQHGD